MKITRKSVVIGIGIVALIAVLKSLIYVIPPKDMTRYALTETIVRIQMYMVENRAAPPNLEALPKRESFANRITDGWGHPLAYEINQNGIITLASYGKDGQPGGEGQNTDHIIKLKTKNDDGTLNIDDPQWLINAVIKE